MEYNSPLLPQLRLVNPMRHCQAARNRASSELFKENNMKARLRIIGPAIVLATLMGACSSDSDDGLFVSSGLPQDKLLSDLDETEAQQLADARTANVQQPEVREAFCTLTSVLTTVFSRTFNFSAQADVPDPSCEQLVAQCEREPFGSGDAGADADADAEFQDMLSECDATVGELENCLDAGLQQLVDSTSQVTCENLEEDGAPPDLGEALATPAECEALEEQCPSVINP